MAQFGQGALHAECPDPSVRIDAKAVSYFRDAAEGTNPSGLFELGKCSDLGLSAPKDPARAAALFRQAAEKGQRDAQAWLADMLDKGEGVERDPVEAYAWFVAALRSGNRTAQEGIQRLRGVLSEEELERAEARGEEVMEQQDRREGEG